VASQQSRLLSTRIAPVPESRIEVVPPKQIAQQNLTAVLSVTPFQSCLKPIEGNSPRKPLVTNEASVDLLIRNLLRRSSILLSTDIAGPRQVAARHGPVKVINSENGRPMHQLDSSAAIDVPDSQVQHECNIPTWCPNLQYIGMQHTSTPRQTRLRVCINIIIDNVRQS
jgi:hypothetical protein